MKTNQENFKIVDINDLADVCGFFDGETPVNNGYGCKHNACSEWELVKIVNGEQIRKDNLEYQILIAAMRNRYGSWENTQKAIATNIGKEYAKKIKHNLMYLNEFVILFGCKWQGKCYSFSCPIANRCDVQDLREYESDFLSEYEDEDDDYRTDLMLVTDPELMEKL